MNEVEQVAAAIWSLNRDTDCNDYGQLAKSAKKYADEMAVAAITALDQFRANKAAIQSVSPSVRNV